MRVLLLTIILGISLRTYSQSESDINTLLSADLFTYSTVAFKWNLEGKLQVLLNEGINYLDENQSEQALANLNDFLKLDTTTWVAYYYRGICFKKLNKFKSAERDFLRVITMNENSYEAHLELSKVYQIIYNFRKAEKYADKAIDIKPKEPLPYMFKGDIEFYQRNIRGAVRNYKQSLEKDPGFSASKTKLALIEMIKSGNVLSGLPMLDDLLSKDSLNKTALIIRSAVNSEMNPKKSLTDYNKLVRLIPENMFIRLSRGLLFVQLNDYESAFSDFRKVIQANNDSETSFIGQQTAQDKKIDILNAGYYLLQHVYGLDESDAKKIKKAYCQLLITKYEDCIATLSTVKDHQKSGICLYLKAIAYEHSGQHNMALDHYHFAIFYDNDIFDAHKKRSIYRFELKDWKGVNEDFKEMLRLRPESPIVYRLRGLVKINRLDFQGAILEFTKYLEFDTLDAEIWKQRGIARSKLKELKGSNEDYSKALELDPKKNQALFDIVSRQYLEIQDTTKAINILKLYLQTQLGELDARVKLAIVYAESKKWNLAKLEIDTLTRTYRSFIIVTNEFESDFSLAKGFIDFGNGNYKACIRNLNRSLKSNSKNFKAKYLRGKAYLKLNDYENAAIDFQELEQLDYKDASEVYKNIKIHLE